MTSQKFVSLYVSDFHKILTCKNQSNPKKRWASGYNYMHKSMLNSHHIAKRQFKPTIQCISFLNVIKLGQWHLNGLQFHFPTTFVLKFIRRLISGFTCFKPTPMFPNKLKNTKTIITGAFFHTPDTPWISLHALFPLRLIPGKTYNNKSQTTIQISILLKSRGKPHDEIENWWNDYLARPLRATLSRSK